jgi:uncharacterized protein YunC (DUF1805 family)
MLRKTKAMFLVLLVLEKITYLICGALDVKNNNICFMVLSMFVKNTYLICSALDVKEN